MGTERLITVLVSCGVLFSLGCSASAPFNAHVQEARTKLKDYALISCLISIDRQSELAKDLTLSKRSVSFMGNGDYQIVQNEETFETEHDPYERAVHILTDQAKLSRGYMKNGARAESYGCFQVYHSQAFNDFITSQDKYIVKPT